MPNLVRHDALQFVAAHHPQQANRHRHRRLVRIASDRKRIGRWIVDDEHSRHAGELRGDRHLFDDIEQLRMIVLLNFPRAGHLQQRIVSLIAGVQPHHAPHAECHDAAQ